MNVIHPMPANRRPMHCFRAFVVAVAALAAAAPLQADASEQTRLRLTPEQRRDMWERMTPEQRAQWRDARSSEDRQRTFQQFSPEQRRELWQQLSPEQRELMMRRLTPEQRQGMRGQMTPEERQALRERFLDRQPDGRPRVEPGAPPRYQLSPEERQRLRAQIEAQREVYRGSNGGKKGTNK